MTTKNFVQKIKTAFHNGDDLICREFDSCGVSCAIFHIEGGTDKILLEQDVLRPLMKSETAPTANNLAEIIFYEEPIEKTPFDECAASVAEGNVIIFIDGGNVGLMINLRKFEKRAVTEPPTSSVLKGPREGFIEEIKTDVSLVRRRLKTPDFVVKSVTIGRYSGTLVSIGYIDGIADNGIVDALMQKISAIDIDGVIDSAYVAAFISDRKHSIFNQVGSSEKPDIIAAKILEGRIAVFVDGSPIVLTVPFVLFEDLQDGYDYYSGDWRVVMIRIFRLLGAMLTVILPGAYVALQSYHYHLLPLKFLITLLGATSGIPFPPAIEMLFVLTLFEILNQASIRMPRFMGISLSIVGAIVLGETAVKAGLISSPAVLVTALSAIGIFCVPDEVGTMSILRFLFLCVSAVLGLFGIIITFLLILAYLVSLENFGAPYLAPYAPRINPDLKDALLKSSITDMKKRPYSIPNKNRTRLNKNGG